MISLRTVAVAAFVIAMTSQTALAQAPTTPAPEQKPAAAPPPVTLFPTEARFAFIDFQRIATTSESGKIAARILKEFSDKKVGEIEAQNRQLQSLVAKRNTTVAAETSQLARDAARLEREIEFARQSAQAEFTQLRNDIDADLQRKVIPVVAEIAKERSLHAVFTADSNLLYLLPALDISGEVVKRMDLQAAKAK